MDTIILVILSLILIGSSALFSGLTLGILSLSVFELKRKADLGDAEADIVYPIRALGNELLVSLIIGNVLVNAALTVVIDALSPGDTLFAAVLTVALATIIITTFGEILPMAFLKKNGLRFSAKIAPYLTFYLNVLHPFSSRIGSLLDKYIGGEMPTIYSTDELVKILEEHEVSNDSDIEADEIAMVRNAISFGDKLVKDVMTPESMITSIKADETLSPKVLKDLYDSGHSRFPVYEEKIDNVVGMLYMRDLIDARKHSKTARSAMDKQVFYVNDNQALDHVLNAFITTNHHLFIVINEFSNVVGVIAIEDIIEEIMGREIVDEFDRYDDLREVALLRAQKRRKKSRVVGRKKPSLD